MLVKEAVQITGGLSTPSKMPGFAYNLPAEACVTGQTLRTRKGSVCASCYARKNRYAWTKVRDAMFKRLWSLQGDAWVDAMAFLINRKRVQGHEYFRWHDSGDLHGKWHLDKILDVCGRTPMVQHWLPTKEYKMVKDRLLVFPGNLTVRLSAHYIDKMPRVPVVIGGILPVSTVHTSEDVFPDALLCPAQHQEGKCGDCRACWDKQVQHVSYPKH